MTVQHVTIWDALGEDGKPVIARDHARLDETERDAVSRYLAAGALVAATTERDVDVLAASAEQAVVPQNIRTDGEWVWSDEVLYYVRQHGLAPDEVFLEHLRARGFGSPRAASESEVREAWKLVTPDPAPS